MGPSENDAPEAQGIRHIEVGFTEGFERSAIPTVRAAFESRWGPPDAKASHEPEAKAGSGKKDEELRGGPHLLGDVYRYVWRVTLDDLLGPVPTGAPHHLDSQTIQRVRAHVEFAWVVLSWATHLPFGVVYLGFRCRPDIPKGGGWSFFGNRLLDEILKGLGGRISPNNVNPRSQMRWLVGAKVSEERMERLRAISSEELGKWRPSRELRFRNELQEIAPVLGAQESPLYVSHPFGNVMTVHGEGGSGAGESAGAFSLYLYSTGNLMSIAQEFLIPLWVPYERVPTHWWDFNFMPYLIAATKFAQFTTIEAGRIEERLGILVEDFRRAKTPDARARVWPSVRESLLELQGEVEYRRQNLDMAAARSESRIGEPAAKRLADGVDSFVMPTPIDLDYPFGFPDEAGETWVRRWLENKKTMEAEGRSLLDNHAVRLRSMLDAITSNFQWEATRDMRRLTKWMALLTVAALAVALATLFR